MIEKELASELYYLDYPNLVINRAAVITDASSRKGLIGATTFYFEGVTHLPAKTTSSKFEFTIDNVDPCTSSTIRAQSISLAAVTYGLGET